MVIVHRFGVKIEDFYLEKGDVKKFYWIFMPSA